MRFNNDIWNCSKLIDLVSIHARIGWQGLRQSEFLNYGEIYLITGTDFNNGVINFNGCKFIDNIRYEQDKNIQIKINDILITKDGSIGKIAYVEYLDKKATLNAGVYRIRVENAKILPKYLFYYLNGNRLLNFASKQMTGGTIKHLNQSSIINMPISYPGLKTQTKLYKLFDLIERRINIQIKIISDLKVLKKELCNRYFKSVHNDTWLGYVTLKDILTERKEYCGKDGTYIHGTLSKEGVSPKTERYDRDFLVKNENKQYKVTHFNDICYNPANLKFGVICRNTYGDLIFSPIYVTFEIADTVYPAYIELFLSNANFIGRIRRYEQGTVYERMAVYPEDFLSYETRMPIYEEQVKFADKIQRIQDKIELETLFLKYLQKQRKYLLNAMFI